MSSKLDIHTSKHGDVCVVKLDGMLDGHTAPDLERHMVKIVEAGHLRLVLNLTGLTYIASAGVGIMINYFQQASQQGGCLHIACPAPTVKEIFNLLGLEALLQIFDDLDTAITVAAS